MLLNVYIADLEDEIPANLTVDTSKYADDCTLDQAVGAGEISHVQQGSRHYPKLVSVEQNDYQRQKNKGHVDMLHGISIGTSSCLYR